MDIKNTVFPHVHIFESTKSLNITLVYLNTESPEGKTKQNESKYKSAWDSCCKIDELTLSISNQSPYRS